MGIGMKTPFKTMQIGIESQGNKLFEGEIPSKQIVDIKFMGNEREAMDYVRKKYRGLSKSD
jgi:hypothetical protein